MPGPRRCRRTPGSSPGASPSSASASTGWIPTTGRRAPCSGREPEERMAITDPLLLPADVLLVPVADLPEEVRRQFPHGEGDYAISRPRSRSTSRVLDAGAAALLGEFRSP